MDTDCAGMISVDLDDDHIEELERRAESMGLFTEEYCAIVLAQFLRSDEEFVLVEE